MAEESRGVSAAGLGAPPRLLLRACVVAWLRLTWNTSSLVRCPFLSASALSNVCSAESIEPSEAVCWRSLTLSWNMS